LGSVVDPNRAFGADAIPASPGGGALFVRALIAG
jgi:hypothetical protein